MLMVQIPKNMPIITNASSKSSRVVDKSSDSYNHFAIESIEVNININLNPVL